MKTLIIQTSPFHTASTFLINALYGLIPELSNKKIIGIWNENYEDYFDNIICIKCHNTNIDELLNIYGDNYYLLFICSERKERNYLIDEKYRYYDNTIIFDFNDLNETQENSIPQIIDNIFNHVNQQLNKLDIKIKLDKEKSINRIRLMNEKYEEIKNKPFSYIDDFFEIHGSHRNRNNIS